MKSWFSSYEHHTNHDLSIKVLSRRNECFIIIEYLLEYFSMTIEKITMNDLYRNFCIF